MKRIYWILVLILLTCLSVQAQSLKVFFGNLHSHTSYSDGSGTPDDAYKHARDIAGLDFLAITEHNHASARSKIAKSPELYSGSSAISLKSYANQYTVNNSFVAIYGQEFSTIGSGNHANVLEVNEVIQTTDVPNGEWDKLLNTWLATNKDSEGKNAIILLNHPNASKSRKSEEYGIDDFSGVGPWLTALDKHAQLINIINGPSHKPGNPGRPSENEFLRYLDLGLHVAPTADQDNHRRNWGSAADTRTGVITNSLTKANILKALRNRNVYASEDKNLHLIAHFNGNLIGSRVSGTDLPNSGDELEIKLEIQDKNEPDALYIIDIFADNPGDGKKADIIKEFQVTGDGTHDLKGVKYTGGNQYFFIRIEQSDDDGEIVDKAWMAPVWFEEDVQVSVPAINLSLEVNLRTEVATITNHGSRDVNLKDWKLISLTGRKQEFTFPNRLILKPGKSVEVVSGPNASSNGNVRIKWTNSYVWNNSGDIGQLWNEKSILITSSDQN